MEVRCPANRSLSATPKLHDCNHRLHRKVSLQIATGNLHPLMPLGDSKPDIQVMKNARTNVLTVFMAGMEGFGHFQRPREFTIDD